MRVAATIASVALALLNLIALLGAGYIRVAGQRLDTPDQSAVVAAGIASNLAPWSSEKLALRGWALAQDQQADAANGAYLEALRWAPADPLLWAEYAQAQARVGRFDVALTLALTQATQLAPQSPAVQGAIADLGVSYWLSGNAAQRALWLASMRYELAHGREAFLSRVLARGRGRTFCRDAAGTLGEIDWCGTVVQ